MKRTIPIAVLITAGLLAPRGTSAAPEISNVRVDYVYHEGFVVAWETDTPSTSRIEYGEGLAFDRTTPSPVSLRLYHRVTVSECLADTTYTFRVVGIDGNGDESVSGPHDIATTIVPVFPDHTLPSTAGTDYPVGPDFEIKELRDVPWENLGPGDSVRIHWRPEPYVGKFLINTRGTPEAPIRIVGVPGPNGERPTIDGKNASTRGTLQYRGDLQELSVVCIDAPWGERPGYLLIQGLHITGAYSDYEFTSASDEALSYWTGAAAIRIQKGDNLVIRNCEISDCSNGLFAVSAALAGNYRTVNGERIYIDTELTREVLIEGNYIHGNGQADVFDEEGNLVHRGWLEHQSYIQCLGVTYQYNRYGPMRPGAQGSSLKDRSSGTVVRHNWIEGGAHTLDLVEAQEHWEAAIQDARYRENYVYGNLFRVGNQGSIFHYGGDNGANGDVGFEHYREGTLYFFHNTLYSLDEVFRWRTSIFDLDRDVDDPLPRGQVEIANNVFYREGSENRDSLFQLLIQQGSANLGVNWINADGQANRDDLPFMGSIVGWEENMILGSGMPFAKDTYLPGSPLIDRAMPIPAAVLQAGHSLEEQINPMAAGGSEAFPLTLIEPRVRNGSAMDLGALEAAPPVLTGLRVEPEEAYVTAGGDTIAFSAVPLDQYGLEIEVAGSVTWNTDAGATGSIDSAGIFTSGEVGGPFQIRASFAGLNAEATVTVFVPQSLRILTDAVEAEIGETVALRAELVDQNGGTIAHAPVVFTLEGESANFIDAEGQLVAVEAGGPYRLVASFGALTAEGAVTVIRKRLPVLIEQVWPEPFAVDVPLETSLELLFPLPASFEFTDSNTIRLYQDGVSEPIWSFDPDENDPNEGLTKVSFQLPTLAPGTSYYVLTDRTWVRINQEPWRPGDFEDEEAWRFTTVEVDDPYQVWVDSEFGADAANLAVSGAGADPDGDRFPNLMEYALGSDPRDANARPMIDVALVEDGGTSLYGPSFPLIPDSGIEVTVAFSRDLVNWDQAVSLESGVDGATSGSVSAFVVHRDLATNGGLERVSLARAPESPVGFYRIVVRRIAP